MGIDETAPHPRGVARLVLGERSSVFFATSVGAAAIMAGAFAPYWETWCTKR